MENEWKNADFLVYNKLLFEKLKWAPSLSLIDGMKKTYSWIDSQIQVEVKK
jgi:hypothetical protein